MQTHLVATTVHGRYLVEGGSDELLFIAFHGYGENAERHLQDVKAIDGIDDWTVVAIQALHPFYNMKTQEVVATWMTKLDRNEAIADNIAYVGQVRERFPRATKVVYEGFSQGAAMAYRTAAVSSANGVIVLGGDLPPDVIESGARLPPVLVGRGTDDEWFNDAKLKKDLKYLESITHVTTCVYPGGHEWSSEFRRVAAEFLRNIAAF